MGVELPNYQLPGPRSLKLLRMEGNRTKERSGKGRTSCAVFDTRSSSTSVAGLAKEGMSSRSVVVVRRASW